MIICLLIPLSTVSASDINNTADDQVLSATPSVDTLSASVNPENNNDTLSVQENENLLSAGVNDSGSDNLLGDEGESEYKTFTELYQLYRLSEGTLLLHDNYKFNPETDSALVNGIDIRKTITIDGNGHTIDGNGVYIHTDGRHRVSSTNTTIADGTGAGLVAAVFKVWSDDTVIKNLIIQNSYDSITVYGKNTLIQNIQLYNNTGSGGLTASPICFKNAKKGYIVDCTFDNYNNRVYQFVSTQGSENIEIRDSHFYNLISVSGGTIWSSTTSDELKVYNCDFINNTITTSRGVISSHRSNLIVEDCNFINITKTTSGMEGVIVHQGAIVTIKNCNITHVTANAGRQLFDFYSIELDHVNFTDVNCYAVVSYSFTMSGSINVNVHDCNFTNVAQAIRLTQGSGHKIENCNFDAGTQGVVAIYLTTSGTVDINDCKFYGKYSWLAPVGNEVPTTGRFSISNCYFNSTSSNKDSTTANAITTRNASSVSYNLDGNTFDCGNTALPDIYGEVRSWSTIDTLYVSPEGTGSGRQGDECNLSYALSHISDNGHIYLTAGEYTLTENIQPVCNIKGLDKENVIINMNQYYIQMFNLYLDIEDITFQNANSSNGYILCAINGTIKNCDFKHYSAGALVRVQNFGQLLDCNIEDWNTTGNMISAGERSIVNRLTVNNVDAGYLYSALSTANSKYAYNINISDSKFSNEVFYKNSEGHGQVYENITIKNTTLKYFSSDTNKNSWYSEYIYNNITLDNCTFTGSTVFSYNYADSYNEIHVIDAHGLNNTLFAEYRIFNINIVDMTEIPRNVIITNSSFEDFNVNNLFTIKNVPSYAIYDLYNVTFKNLTVNGTFTPFSGSKLDMVKFIDYNVTGSNVVLNLSNQNVVNSLFDNMTGHILVNGSMDFTNTVFSNNINPDLNGSCVIWVEGSIMHFYSCNFTNNSALNGAFYMSNQSTSIYFYNCNFTNNSAIEHGGAVYLEPSGAAFSRDTKSETGVPFEDISKDPYNSFYREGASNKLLNAYVVLDPENWVNDLPNGTKNYKSNQAGDNWYDACTFMKAFTLISDEGSIYFVNASETHISSTARNALQNEKVKFIGNNTTLSGMLFDVNGKSGVEVHNFIFTGCSESVILWDGKDGVIDNCTFIGNGGDSVSYGGAVVVNGNHLSINNSRFINNAAVNEDNGYGGALYVNASDIIIENCNFTSNSAFNSGSHIYVEADLENITLRDLLFNSSERTGSGYNSAVSVQGNQIKVLDSVFEYNDGKNGAGLSIIRSGIYVTVTGNNFTNNTAENGAVYLDNSVSYLTFTGNNFTNNTASNGGALYIKSYNLELATMGNNIYENNSAVNGGAVFVDYAGSSLYDANFTGNTAVNGGAVYINAGDVVLNNLRFTGNNATLGGALYVNNTGVNVVDSVFIGNTANVSDSKGSAIYVSKTGGATLTNVELNDNYVYDEVRSQRGDIYVDGGKFADKGITYGTSPYQQYLSYETIVLTVAYVSQNGGGKGVTPNNPTTLEDALNVIEKSNSIIYLVGNDDFIYNNYTLKNLDNVTIVNYNDKQNRKITGNNKYLFILLNNKIIKLKIIHLIHHIKNV